MSNMRPDTARLAGASARSAAKPRSMIRALSPFTPSCLSARMAVLVLAASFLAACSQDGGLSVPLPPHPNVPAIEHDTYPTIGAAPDTGRKILEPPQRAALEQDIARTGAQHGHAIEQRLQAESEFNTGTN